MTRDELAYIDWFDNVAVKSNNIKHFEHWEIVSKSVKNGVANEWPPPRLWPNCLPALKVIDNLRAKIDQSLNVSSGYRAQEYNREVGGENNSYHLEFRAFDFSSNYVTPRALYDLINAARDTGLVVGGLGLYSWGVHFDCRDHNATWGG